MPQQIMNADEFKIKAQNASECRIVRRGDKVKLKLRTTNKLYVYITNEENANTLLSELSIEKVEI